MPASAAPQIAAVMFTCEAAGRAVATGHRMRPAEFAAITGSRAFRCAACNAVHTWTTDTAWLQPQRMVA